MRKRSKILYFEDNESFVRLARAVLTGCEIDEAKTVDEGMMKLESGMHYDLVFVNMHLTEYNESSGEDILEYIRDNRPSLPRIVITGGPLHGPIYSVFFERYACSELLTKGESIGPDLRRIVRKILQPHYSGSPEILQQKESLVIQLREVYDHAVRRVGQQERELDDYRVRLRESFGENEAEDATKVDRERLRQEREDLKMRYEALHSRILGINVSSELEEIANALKEGW